MPKRTDLKSILILGAGPIVIGQACEFDYSGTQAVKALKEEGYRVILVNANPASIMTDVVMADATYVEPVVWHVVEKIIEKERPDAILPTMGGQTALNCALDLARHGVLEKYQVEMIGAKEEAIEKAEDREKFRAAMEKIGLDMPHSGIAHNLDEALALQKEVGFPVVIRPSFTMGGTGGGIAYNREEFIDICERGLDLSPKRELLIDEAIIGWKEFELEMVRDSQDNCIVVCSIENLDPMGVHTGDSITVAPAQTLTDKEFQIMRNAAIAILREIGVDTGGSNVQFGVSPKDGRLVVIEMNPRVSRSSALASKATGFPIAKIAAKLAVGFNLDELSNEITGGAMPASFEPTIDYVVTKIPRFNFEKFPQTEAKLTTQMKSVGEAMAMGRTFQESLQKALRSLEVGFDGLTVMVDRDDPDLDNVLTQELNTPSPERLLYIADSFRHGFALEAVQHLTHIDPWFLVQIRQLVEAEETLKTSSLISLSAETLRAYKRQGFADARLASLLGVSEPNFRNRRRSLGVRPVYKRVDTCAAEFNTQTAYLYSTYEDECEADPSHLQPKIMVLGGGPNRIGQGIEFDCCCVHAAMALREDGYQCIMVNCNPETVSTDYDISDRLYFEPLTVETVLDIVDVEQPHGVIVHYGGQTPLKLAQQLEMAGVPIIGTSPDAIDRAEDRERFQQMVKRLNLAQPPNGMAKHVDEAIRVAADIGYPLVARPSYVLGGRAMKIIHDDKMLRQYMESMSVLNPDVPILLDHFINDAIEVDVDAVCDGQEVYIGGIMEHIEQAGIHSGDSSCSIPPYSLSPAIQEHLKQQMALMAKELGVIGLINAQFALRGEEIYILEVNPRASRTVPFVSKATGVSLAKVGTRCMLGQTLAEQAISATDTLRHFSVKAPVFPFARFSNVDTLLGPEMKSTGEAMGIGADFGEAYGKALLGCSIELPRKGRLFVSVRDADKPRLPPIIKQFVQLGFEVVATAGTAHYLQEAGIVCERVNKVLEGRPHIVDMIKNDEIDFIVNTTEGRQTISDSYSIRRSALQHKIASTTTIAGAKATCLAMMAESDSTVNRLQDLMLEN